MHVTVPQPRLKAPTRLAFQRKDASRCPYMVPSPDANLYCKLTRRAETAPEGWRAEQEDVVRMLAATHPAISFGLPKGLGEGQQQRDRRVRGRGWGCQQGVAYAHLPTTSQIRLCNTIYDTYAASQCLTVNAFKVQVSTNGHRLHCVGCM